MSTFTSFKYEFLQHSSSKPLKKLSCEHINLDVKDNRVGGTDSLTN